MLEDEVHLRKRRDTFSADRQRRTRKRARVMGGRLRRDGMAEDDVGRAAICVVVASLLEVWYFGYLR